MDKIVLSPSIMCADLLNLRESVRQLEQAGVDALHIDVIDARFSPSMPLGIDTISKLRSVTDLPFDIHIMAVNNDWFVAEMLAIGVQQITFHYESARHLDRLVNLIKRHGVKAGVALNPATPAENLRYALAEIDCILLMLINPGFAGDSGESQVSYAKNKVAEVRAMANKQRSDCAIQVDGRVSLDSIPELVAAGADNLVLGSTSLYQQGFSFEQNLQRLHQAVSAGLAARAAAGEKAL